MPGPGNVSADRGQAGFLCGFQVDIPELPPDPEIVDLPGVEEDLFIVEIEVVLLYCECHFRILFGQLLLILSADIRLICGNPRSIDCTRINADAADLHGLL